MTRVCWPARPGDMKSVDTKGHDGTRKDMKGQRIRATYTHFYTHSIASRRIWSVSDERQIRGHTERANHCLKRCYERPPSPESAAPRT